jgi:hypothetical protein
MLHPSTLLNYMTLTVFGYNSFNAPYIEILKTIGSCNSIVSIKTRLWAGQYKFQFPEGARDFSLSHNSQTVWGSSSLLFSAWQGSFPEHKVAN